MPKLAVGDKVIYMRRHGVLNYQPWIDKSDELIVGKEYAISYVSLDSKWIGIAGAKYCYKTNHFKDSEQQATGWKVLSIGKEAIHCYPVNDLRAHDLSYFVKDNDEVMCKCECSPRNEMGNNGVLIFVHSSFDGREAMEEANEILNQK